MVQVMVVNRGVTKEEVDTVDVAVVKWEDAVTLGMAVLVATAGDMVGLDAMEMHG